MFRLLLKNRGSSSPPTASTGLQTFRQGAKQTLSQFSPGLQRAPALLSQRGSLYFTRPTLMTHIAQRADLEAIAQDLVDIVLAGKVRIEVERRYPLADAARAHADLEARITTGASILVP